jgi:TolB-like protein
MPDGPGFFSELRRRRVIRTAVVYVAAAWVGIEVATTLIPVYGGSNTQERLAVGLILLGLPVAVTVSWLFDITPEGFKRDAGPPGTGLGIDQEPAEMAAVAALAPAPAADKPVPRHSIAVLPFVDMSAEKDQAYLGDGVAEEILNALVKVTPLKVSGRTSSFAFRDRDLPASEIGTALGVAHVLEGSVRKHGDRVRITAQVIQADEGFHLWSETYDGDLTDIFDLQDRIARSVVEELEVVLDVDQVRLVASMTDSPEAYDAFLKGRRLAQIQDGEGVLARAVEHLEEAVRLDPEFALAWAWLGNANFFLPEHNDVRDWKEHLEAGKKAAAEAIRLDPELSDAHLAMSYAHLLELDIAAQWEARRRACELDPASVAAMHEFGMAYALMGLIEEGYPDYARSVANDPFSPAFTGALGIFQWILGDIEAASASFDRSAELGFPLVIPSKGMMLRSVGRPQEAREYILSELKAHRAQLPPDLQSRAAHYLITKVIAENSGWARWLMWLSVKGKVGNPKYLSDLTFKSTLALLGKAEAFFSEVRTRPNTYLSGSLMQVWYPTEAARSIRTHPDFPQFVEDIGFVRLWQEHGWPPQIQPKPGTDGSDLQFTCS